METKTYLYRAYDCGGELCYVGITKNFDIRLRSHIADKPWWKDEVDHISVRIYDTRADAEFEEAKAIAEELPKYNEIPGKRLFREKEIATSPDRLSPPKTRLPLPSEEIEYLRALDQPTNYQRAAALQEAGWPVSEIIKSVKISPTPVQLRVAIKLTRSRDFSRPVPVPPPTRAEKKKAREASAVHLTESEKQELIQLSKKVKKYRPGHPPGHPLHEAKEAYNSLIKQLRESGVSVSEMAETAGVDASNIRRRVRES